MGTDLRGESGWVEIHGRAATHPRRIATSPLALMRHFERTLCGVILALALGASGPSDALSLAPNPVALVGFEALVARFTFVGESTGAPAGGIVLAGTVAPTDTVLMFAVEYVAQSIAPLALAQIGRTSGTLSGLGWIPGGADDWSYFAFGPFPGPTASFASNTLDTGATGDVIFVAAASFPAGTTLAFYFQGYHGVPQAYASATVVPEPMTFALLAGGLAALAVRRRG
jgi:hypothetical protein